MKKKHEVFKPSLLVQTQKTHPQTTLVRRSQRQIFEQASKAQKLRDLSEIKDKDPLIIPRKHKVEQQIPTIQKIEKGNP